MWTMHKCTSQSKGIFFSVAAITHYHKLSGLKQHRFIGLQFCGSEIQYRSHWAKIKMSAVLCSFLEALGKSFPSLFCIPQLPPSKTKASSIAFLWSFFPSQVSF